MTEIKEKVLFGGQLKVNSLGQVFKSTYGEWREVSKTGSGADFRTVQVWVGDKRKYFSVGNLVAQAFLPNPEGKTMVYHKDGNTKNDAVDNLVWTSHAEVHSKYARRIWKRAGWYEGNRISLTSS